jgi:hypothetical protein
VAKIGNQLVGFGDPDFEMAIAKTYALGKNIPLVTFGHMHHTMRTPRINYVLRFQQHKTQYI